MAAIFGARTHTPRYFLVILYLTILYLAVELMFSAHLLDVAGGRVSQETLDATEHLGRIISGIAVALALCGSVLCPYLYRRGLSTAVAVRRCLLLSLPVIVTVYWGEKALTDYLVAQSDGLERRNAALLSVASHQLRRDKLEIRGIQLGPDILATAEGKAFVALFSPFVASLPDVDDMVLRQGEALVRQMFMDELGTPQAMYTGPYKASQSALHDRFLAYAREANRCIEVLQKADSKAEEAWQQYVRKLRRYWRSPASVPTRYHDRIRRDLRSEGIEVPDDWRPGDKAGFYRAHHASLQAEVDRQWREGQRKAGFDAEPLPLTLTDFSRFAAHPVIQKQWREKMKLPEHVKLTPGLSFGDFERQVYEPLLHHLAKEKLQELRELPEAFADGGPQAESGRRAMEGIIVPPLALFFSLLGGMLHLCKLSYYLLRMCLPYRRIFLCNLLVFGGLLAVPPVFPGDITRSVVYERVESRAADIRPVWTHGIRWIIQAQRIIYPLGKGALEHVRARCPLPPSLMQEIMP